MKLAAARGIAEVVTDDDLAEDYIIPSVFNRDVAASVARAVVDEAKDAGLARFSEETGTFEVVGGDGASGPRPRLVDHGEPLSAAHSFSGGACAFSSREPPA